jgi:hypothetical protein
VLDRIPWPSEQAHQTALADLRTLSDSLGIKGIVPAPPDDGTTAAPAPTDAVTAPDTDALVAAGWTPPTSPEVAPVTTPEVFTTDSTPADSSLPPDAPA